MDKKSKILISVFIVSIFVSIFFTYKRSFIDQNFVIEKGEIEGNIEEETEQGI